MDNLKPFFIFFSSHFLLNLFKERNKKFILHVKRNLWNIRFFQFESLLYPVITYTLINRKHKYPLSIHFFRQKGRISFPSPSLSFYLPKPVLLSIKLSTNLIKLGANFLLPFFVLSTTYQKFFHPSFLYHTTSSVSSTDFHELNACTFLVNGCRTSLANLRPLGIDKLHREESSTPFIRMKRKRPSLSSLSFFPSILPLPRTTNLSSPLDVAMLAFFFSSSPPRGPFPYSFSPFRPTTLV